MSAQILYEDIELPDASIASIKKNGGAFTWEIDCHTKDYSQVEGLQAYAYPLTTEVSTGGLIYVRSGKSPGILKIKDLTSGEYIPHSNCYLQGPIETGPEIITPDGAEYLFTVTVQQSAITME